MIITTYHIKRATMELICDEKKCRILTTVSSLGTILTELSTSSSVIVTKQQFSHSDGSGIVSLHVTHGCSWWHMQINGDMSLRGYLKSSMLCAPYCSIWPNVACNNVGMFSLSDAPLKELQCLVGRTKLSILW